MEDEKSKVPTALIPNTMETRRTEDFVSRYSNNVQLESNSFDLKLVFGLLDQSRATKQPTAKPSVEQHTAISLSWPEVKIIMFYLQVHLTGYEMENGKVKIPASAIPPEPPLTPPTQFDNPQGRAALDLIRKLRAEFITNLSET
jgi:hypothetical protein